MSHPSERGLFIFSKKFSGTLLLLMGFAIKNFMDR